MASVVKQEFDVWHTHLTQGLAAIQEILGSNSPNADELLDEYEQLIVTLPAVEKLRPKTAQSPIDFASALPTIASAKRLIPRIKRFLLQAGKLVETPAKEITQTELSASRKIPELVVQKFEGDITQYASFRKAFSLKYDGLPIPASEKLQHLKSQLQGQPLALIRDIDLTDENYPLALSKLDSQYDQPDQVISALYHRINVLPRADSSPASLQSTFYALQGLITALESHGQRVDDFPPLRDTIMTKYPLNIVESVCQDETPLLTRFQKLMATRIDIRRNIHAAAISSGVFKEKTVSKPAPSATSALTISPSLPAENEGSTSKKPPRNAGNDTKTTKERLPTCIFCSEKHYSAQCSKFETLAKRIPFVQDRCGRCLNKAHATSDCTKSVACRFCNEKNTHNSALCPHYFACPKSPTVPDRSVNFVTRARGAHNTILMNAINQRTRTTHELRVLLDMGSGDTYISERACKLLDLPLSKFKQTQVNVFGGQCLSMPSAETYFEITNGDGFHLTIQADTAPIIPQTVHIFDYAEFIQRYPHYSDLRFVRSGADLPIDVVLGNDYVFDLVKPEKITVQPGLYLVNSEFGYFLTGRQTPSTESRERVTMLASTHTLGDRLALLITPTVAVDRLCALDAIGISELPLTKLREEENALNEFYENLRFVDQRYQIRWPWKSFPPPLANNFGLALGRLRHQLKKLTPAMFQTYDDIISQQLASGVVEEVSDASQMSNAAYYLPHHPVYTPGKSTPLRIVYDGSAKPARGMNSINDAIYKGRNLLSDLTAILLRFRLHRIAVVSDIEKCYLQLSIHPCDRDYVRFLWVRQQSAPASGRNLRVLRFTRAAFGIIASPFLANAVIRHHLDQNVNNFFSFRDIYVDNLISGVSSVPDAQKMYRLGVHIFNKCSMNLRAWSTNSAAFRDTIPNHHRNDSDEISILGILWNPLTDTLKLKPFVREMRISLRTILSSSASFFDPYGWFVPLSIGTKILMQDIRTANLQWDDELPSDLRERWCALARDLESASTQVFPRFQIERMQATTYQLHVFVDASARAYACVVYLRASSCDSVDTFFLFAKARIAPKNSELTIPRLELFAALLGARTLKFLIPELGLKFERVVLWSDSQCVISWIKSMKILPIFIQRRVDEIRAVDQIEIRYVPTMLNPADLPSRGTELLRLSTLWYQGPPFLRETCTNWPTAPDLDSQFALVVPEMQEADRSVLLVSKESYSPITISACFRSSYDKLLRVTSIVIRFLRWFELIRRKKIFRPELSDRSIAQILWVKAEQRNSYPDVIVALKSNKSHPLVRQLRLELDDDGLIRCAGRFCNAPLSEYEMRPILLPKLKDSFLTPLIIRHHHERFFHTGTNATLTTVRKFFWIPSGRAAVYNTVRTCTQCKRYTSRPYRQPEISELPAVRLEKTELPFMNIGIDVFGHIYVSRQKRYVLIVVDLVIRAIDLEPLKNMTAQELAYAFRNIAARRTQPHFVLSDNAPQFELLRQNLSDTYDHNFRWEYIPSKASWMGGAYERLVALAKNALRKTFHGQALTDTSLRTALAEIAAVLNERPLTYVSADSSVTPLTPNHFLRASFSLGDSIHPVHSNTVTASNLIHFWKQSNEFVNRFWSIWRTEYLSFLRERGEVGTSRRTSMHPPQVDDVVLIAEPNISRAKWHLGRIIRLNYSADGQVRSVTLKTGTQNIVRPLTVLYPLEVRDPATLSPPVASEAPQSSLSPSATAPEVLDEETIEINLDLDF